MSTESNKESVRRWFSLLSRENWEEAIRSEWPPAPIVDWFVDMHRPFRAAFPDFAFRIVDIVAEGDKVVVLGKASGTHTAEFAVGELKGIPPSGKKLEWDEAQGYRFENGQFAAGWLVVDGVSRLQQLGVLPEPEMQPGPA